MEELTSALISGRIRTKNNMIYKGIMGPISKSFDFISGIAGDPPESGAGAKVFSNTGRGSYTTSGLHNTFAQRLQQVMNERPGITMGNGFRTYSQQRTLFTGRYSKTSENTGVNPAMIAALAVATNVIFGTITSSPGCKPRALNAQ